jgi:sugar lactone lactonase YvrE
VLAGGSDAFLVKFAAPALGIMKTHTGNFAQGQVGAVYNVAVSNGASAAPTTGTVTVTETVPTGLTLVSMSGTGWTCPSGGNTCTRSDALVGGSSYPPITVTVNVVDNAPTSFSNQVSVSGGGSTTASANDPTTITVNPPTITSLNPSSATAGGAAFTLTVNGTNFLSGAVVNWSGTALTTTFVNATQLTASVPASLIGSAGSASVTVTTSGGASAGATFTINPPPPPPTITSLNPSSAYAGGAAFLLTVNGTSFLSGAVVMWNGTALSTSFVNATQLTASVPAALIATVGTASVTVIGPNGTVSLPAPFTIASALGTNALLVVSAGGTSSVVLAYDGAWTATANDSFLHISAGSSSGTSSALVVFTYDAFSGTGTRTGTLTIAGQTVTVTQAGTNYIGPGPVITLVSSGLNEPAGVTVDGSGNVYIADTKNSAIKEWSASTQQVTTLVSSGLSGPWGVAVDGSGNVYIADTGNNAIKEWSASTQQVTTLVSSGLNMPWKVAVDGSGNVYFVDLWNFEIKEWSASSQQVTTLLSGLDFTYGVAVDGSGNVYFADNPISAIKEWSASTQQVTTLVSSGLSYPWGVAVDGSGNIYIADQGNNAIKEWGASTQQVTTLVSSGLSNPYDVAVGGSGNVYIADTLNNAIKEIPYAFVGPASLTEPASAGTDSLLPVLPSTVSLAGIFAPTSDQGWLTLGAIENGVISFSFSANTSSSRVAHISVLGQQITVTQSAVLPAISGLSPSSATAGGATFTLTISGTNFLSGATVTWNGTALTTTFVSASQVTAAVPGSLIATTGTASVTVTTAGGTSAGATFTINPPPTITTLSPNSATAGGAAFTLTVNGTGFVSGAVVNWNRTALSTSYVSATQLTAGVPASLIASAGSASVTVTTTGGTSAGATFTINPSAPSVPTLVSPANGATGVSRTPALSWSAAAGATSYDVYFGTAASPPLVTNTTATSYSPGTLASGTRYYWKIVAKNGAGSASSAIWSFTTSTASSPSAPTLVSPANGATNVSRTTSLSWSAASGATSYDVYFGTASSPPLVTNTTSTSYSPGSLSAGTKYYWKIVAKNTAGSASSAIWSFTTTTASSPSAPTLVSPANGATNVSRTTSLSWSAASGATSYDVYFGTASSPPLVTNTTSTSYKPATLAATTRYYWKIVAKNGAGSASSAIPSFTTAP